MGFYRNQVLPRIQNKVMDTKVTRATRARVCEGVSLTLSSMTNLSPEELENVFDLLELKRGEKLGCWICGGNEWSARKVRRAETGDPAETEIWTLHVELVCANCKMVADFTDRVLRGP